MFSFVFLTFPPSSCPLPLISNQHFGGVAGLGFYVFLETNPCLWSGVSAPAVFLMRENSSLLFQTKFQGIWTLPRVGKAAVCAVLCESSTETHLHPWNVPGQVRWGLEQPDSGGPACGWNWTSFKVPSNSTIP